jgi:hypothetical protein
MLLLDLGLALLLRLGLALPLHERLLRAQEPIELRWRDVAQLEQDVAQALGRTHVILRAQGFE